MEGFNGCEFFAVRQRLSMAVTQIVERHRTAGRVLTWRLVHDIEKEAIATLQRAGDLDVRYIRMMRSSRWGYVPRVDQPADLDAQEELPAVVSMIQDAYHTLH